MSKSRFSGNRNAPPKGESWIWYTHHMLASPAWKAMTSNAHRVLDRACLEWMNHAGTQNGELAISYDEFMLAGCPSRNAVAEGIRVAEALGFIDVTYRGRRAIGGLRFASTYGLTWLDRADRTSRTNRWKRIATLEEAMEIAARAARPARLPSRVVVPREVAATA